MFINYDLQNRNLPTSLDKVADWLKRANHKHLPSRDTRYLISLLVNLVKVDRHLMSLIRYRKLAVSSYRPVIKLPDEYSPSAKEEKRIAEMKHRYQRSKIDKLRAKIIDGRIIGMGAIELNWKHDGKQHYVDSFKQMPATDLDYDLNDTNSLKYIDTDTKSQKFIRYDFNPETHIIIKDNPLEGYDIDFPGGLLRVNMVHVLLKYWDFFIWANTNEKYADPPRFATYEPYLEKHIDSILEQLAKMGSDSYGAFMKGVDVKVLEALKEGAIKSHVELEASVNRGMSLSIAGQYSASDPNKGHSYAASKVGYEIAENVTHDDLVYVEQELSNQYLVEDYKQNYGEPENAYPILYHEKFSIKDREAHARIVTDYLANGVPVHEDDVYKAINLKPVKADDKHAIKPQTQTLLG